MHENYETATNDMETNCGSDTDVVFCGFEHWGMSTAYRDRNPFELEYSPAMSMILQ